MNLYSATVPVFTNFLTQVGRCLDKAVAYAEQRKFDPEVLVTARLAPDQYPFVGQIQAMCDQAKFTVAKLTGKTPPAHPDNEKTIAEIRARLAAVLDYLASFKPEDFDGAEERKVTYSWMGGKWLRGGDFLDHMALPNFHFHTTTAYAILRHNGVPVGKQDYLGEMPIQGP